MPAGGRTPQTTSPGQGPPRRDPDRRDHLGRDRPGATRASPCTPPPVRPPTGAARPFSILLPVQPPDRGRPGACPGGAVTRRSWCATPLTGVAYPPVVDTHRGDPARPSLSGICGAVGWDIGPVAGAVTVDVPREALVDDVFSATHHGAVDLVPVGDRAVVGAAR